MGENSEKEIRMNECCWDDDNFIHINDRNGWDTLVYCKVCKTVYYWYRGNFNDFYRNHKYPPAKRFNKKIGKLSPFAEKLIHLVSGSLNMKNIKKFCKIKEKDIKGFTIRNGIVGLGIGRGLPSPDSFSIEYSPFIDIKGLGELDIGFDFRWSATSLDIRLHRFPYIMKHKEQLTETTIRRAIIPKGVFQLEEARTIVKFVEAYLKGNIKFKTEE